jgi:hypothetical protein
MARLDPAATGKRLYERFLAPLVLGGHTSPGPAVGARAALALEGAVIAVDRDVVSRVDLVRVRIARRLAPVDMMEGPSKHEWALAAAFHDMVHALHPDMGAFLHRGAPQRLLSLAQQVIDRVPAARSLKEALSRHTFFARAFELRRTDTRVSWWTGSESFLGAPPPPRLLAWPEVRRVTTDVTHTSLADMSQTLLFGTSERFAQVLSLWLAKVPLTDLATASRPIYAFDWTAANLSLFQTPNGRALGLRALGSGPRDAVDGALARATYPHIRAGATANLARIGTVLSERALAWAASHQGVAQDRETTDDAHFARAFGASLALARIDLLDLPVATARSLRARLAPLAQSVQGRKLDAVVNAILAG